MKQYDLLDAQDFQRAVEESGLDVGVLRSIRFGLAYGSKATFTTVKPNKTIEAVEPYATNVVNLALYKFSKNCGKDFI